MLGGIRLTRTEVLVKVMRRRGLVHTHRLGRGFELRTRAWRLVRLFVSWANLLRSNSSCLSSSGDMLSDAMVGVS